MLQRTIYRNEFFRANLAFPPARQTNARYKAIASDTAVKGANNGIARRDLFWAGNISRAASSRYPAIKTSPARFPPGTADRTDRSGLPQRGLLGHRRRSPLAPDHGAGRRIPRLHGKDSNGHSDGR